MPVYSFGEHTPDLPDASLCWIAPNAFVIGQVSLGEDVSVWFGAVLRGDYAPITIGARSNVQDNAVAHADLGCPLVIGEDTTIGHGAVVHGCTIGNGVVIGMGAIVMNNADIGDGSLVAAGAVVTEGKLFPPGSLIMGAPAKAVRALDQESVAKLRQGALDYVQNGRAYRLAGMTA
jgi:carbonic anhydrase/acetyltransferase-like protein (isoleucine patch superfamily)